MGIYLLPASLSVPVLIGLILGLLIPSAKSGKRLLSYYSSSLVNLVYTYSAFLLIAALVFGALYFAEFGGLKRSFALSNAAVFAIIGVGLIVSNALTVRRSKRMAVRRGPEKGSAGKRGGGAVAAVSDKSAEGRTGQTPARRKKETNEEPIVFEVEPISDDE